MNEGKDFKLRLLLTETFVTLQKKVYNIALLLYSGFCTLKAYLNLI